MVPRGAIRLEKLALGLPFVKQDSHLLNAILGQSFFVILLSIPITTTRTASIQP